MSEQGIVIIRHRIIVDDQVIYEGGDEGIPGRGDVYRLALDYARDPSARNVIHQVLKHIVPLYTDLSTLTWNWTQANGDAHDTARKSE